MKKKTLHSELRSCVNVEVAVLGSASLIVSTVSVDVTENKRGDYVCTIKSSLVILWVPA